MPAPASDQVANASRHEIIREYFRRVDAGDPSLLDLFADDVQVYFPKFGIAHGRDGVGALAATLGGYVGGLDHDIDAFRFIGDGDVVAVEGAERGTMSDGTPWPDGKISNGLFCNVFEFSGDLITRVHVYTDPDYASADTERIRALQQG